ncbi:uncharacterized protein KIAA1614 homolog isoform X3 [Heterocephalus glaber]|uniref:Uncharacterized protein KIAA1614 homolog isoform X3 n=1 Tax=Heterocephalus glaber TaxID=10181 RepID=A0AAX6PKJ0_HETGA|nr:uncharacterized protein KIAA1614 homolog isoform X3 [Heterocephalus glaber]
MEGTEAAAEPAGGSPQKPKTGSRITSPVQVTSVVEGNDPEPQLDNGPLSRPWPFPPPKPPRLYRMQLHGSSVLESKVRALKEKMTASKQGVSPTTHEQSSTKKSKCRQVKPGRVQISEDSSLPDAVEVPYAQKLTGGQLDSSVNKEEPRSNGGSRPLPSAPELECWNGQNPLSPEVVWILSDRERGLAPGPDSLPESPSQGITPGWPVGPGPCKITCIPNLRKGRSDPLQDALVTVGDLDSTSLIPEEAFVPRTALLGTLWKARDLGTLGTGGNPLSLSDQVERNRLLLQEMLKVAEQSPPKTAPPAWTPSWNRTAPERSAGDVGWESGIFLQDSEQNRTFGPKPEAVLSTRHEEAKHLLQHPRMKARTRPLRASHDIVPAIAQGSRDGRRSPALGPRMTLACRDSPQSGSLSDSSSGESGSGQWPKQGMSTSHVRFEDEPAFEAEFRHLKRLQQRQRQVLSTELQAVGQGPLRSKPDLADYINQKVGMGAFHRLGDSRDCRGLPLPPPSWASERKYQECGLCPDSQCPDPRVPQELQAARGVEGVLHVSHSSSILSSPFRLLLADPGLDTERLRGTHIGETTTCPEEGDSALNSADTSDGCQTGSEEARTSLPIKASRQTQGSSPRQWDSRPQGGLGQSRKVKTELHGGLPACHSLGVEDTEVGDEVKEITGYTPVGTQFLKEDAIPKPPALEPEMAALESQRQPGSGLGSHQAHPVDPWAPCKLPYATTSSLKLAPSEPGIADQVTESHEYLETIHTSSLQQNHAQPAAPNRTQHPATSPSPEAWVASRTTSPVPHRKAGLAGPCRPGEQEEPVGNPLPLPPPRTPLRTCGLSSPQTQPCIPQARHPLLGLSANCNSCIPLGQQEPWGTAVYRGREKRVPCSQKPDPPLESSRDGGCQCSLGLADVAVFNSVGITLSLTSEEPESCQEAEEGLQRMESSSGSHMLSGASPGASAGPRPPLAAPSDSNKKRSSSIASTLGLKKLFSALGQASRPKLGKSRSYSVEHLQPDAPGSASHTSTHKVKRAPSLQSFHLVSPSRQHRKAASFQNLHSLLSGRGDRSSLYLVEGPGYPSAPGRPAKAPPRRALSVEDVGVPSLARTVGRVVAVFPDGTSQLQLQRSPEGTFGFRVGSGNGRRDSGAHENIRLCLLLLTGQCILTKTASNRQ